MNPDKKWGAIDAIKVRERDGMEVYSKEKRWEILL